MKRRNKFFKMTSGIVMAAATGLTVGSFVAGKKGLKTGFKVGSKTGLVGGVLLGAGATKACISASRSLGEKLDRKKAEA